MFENHACGCRCMLAASPLHPTPSDRHPVVLPPLRPGLCATLTDRVAALSNRAACLLVLERYEAAVLDCTAALRLNLSGLDDVAAGETAEPQRELCDEVEGSGTMPSGSLALQQQQQQQQGSAAGIVGLASKAKCVSTEEEPLHSWLLAAHGAGAWPYGVAKAQQLSRVLARRGAASAHLKGYDLALLDYGSARLLAGYGGDSVRVEQLEADMVRLKVCTQPSSQQKLDPGQAPINV